MKNTVCHDFTDGRLELWTTEESRPERDASKTHCSRLGCKKAKSARCPPEETATGQHIEKEEDVEQRVCQGMVKPAVLPGATGTVRCMGLWTACEMGFQNACRHQN